MKMNIEKGGKLVIVTNSVFENEPARFLSVYDSF